MQQRLTRAGSLFLSLGLFLAAHPVQALVTKLTPLREELKSEQLIFTVKVEKLDPEKPSVVFKFGEDLKGKAPFEKLPVNLTADSEGQREKHTEKLLKRLAPDLELVVFTSKRGKRYTATVYTNGTWFQLIGQIGDADKVRWSFTHCEPYLRRTFKGSTEELIKTVRDGLAGKKDPPEPDAKEPPGLGPEVEKKAKPAKKRGAAGGGGGPLFAVIPTFVLIGPLALLATLFPAVFGGLALVMRRWLVLLSIASLNSTLYLAHSWFRGSLKDTGWGSNLGLWLTMAGVTLAGVLWSWLRNRAASQANPGTAAETPRRTEQVILGALSVLGLACVLYGLLRGTLSSSPWKELLAIWIVAWAGTLYTVFLTLRARGQALARPAPATEGIMLWALVFACAGLGATTVRRPATEGVQKLWVFEPSETGAFLSSPRIEGDRVYIAAIHGAVNRYGVLYCLERDTGKEVWKFDDEGAMKEVFSTPCLVDGRLYIGEGLHEDHGCKFYCLDAATGSKLWHFETTSHTESSPCVAEGKVFFGAGDDGLYCLDAVKGTQQWHFQEPLHIDANPIVEGKRLFVGSGVSRTQKKTELLCLGTASGNVIWRKRANLPAWGSPTIQGGQVFFGVGNGRMNESVAAPEKPAGAVLCLDAGTGEQVWRYDVGDGVLVKPVVDAEHVYFGCRDRHCYCLDRARGELCWKVDLTSPIVAAPALMHKNLYVAASGGRVCCLETESGKIIWSFDVGEDAQLKAQLFSSLAVVRVQGAEEEHTRVFVGAGLESPLRSVAALYCLRQP